ncbi:MAG: hypothetical protein QNJ41_01995 [Xenococcaceae cyanobacterium MO_188.B32]|nr:hypothetical protein [Xenococcaceae cyanobacterium MO_188.B32]
MNNQSKIIVGFMIAFSVLGLSTFAKESPTLANNEPTAPIDDGARHLRGLETKNSADWNFAIEEENQQQTDYQLRIYEPEVRIVEQKEPEWRNTGEQPNYSVLVDVYDFTEEEVE